MEAFLRLLLLSSAMFGGSFLAGLMPLAITLSEANMMMVTTTGAGLLVGTSLAVIIPEGIHTLYASALSHEAAPAAVKAEQVGKRVLQAIQEQAVALGAAAAGDGAGGGGGGGGGAVGGLAAEGKAADVVAANEHHINTARESHGHVHSPVESAHAFIGPMLCLGFVFMLLIDQLGSGHSHGGPAASPEGESATRHKTNTTLIGLVVHAAADGIALGAAATNRLDVEVVIFFAIMLHKAPAAFGLTSFLLHEGFDRSRIRHSLMVFSLAAPVAAIITYFCLSQQNMTAWTSVDATGLGMLFSAGTFLYVATMHVLPGISRASPSVTSVSSETGAVSTSSSSLGRRQLALLVFGIFLPLVLSVGHHH